MRILCLALLVLLPVPAHADWWVAETDHFKVYSEGKSDETAAFVERLERFAMAMRTMQSRPATADDGPKVPLTIFRWGEVSDVARLHSNSQSPVAGFFIPRAGGSVAFVPARETFDGSPGVRSSNEAVLRSETILFHEYAHHFMYQYFPAAYPAWYVEGFAELYSTAKFMDNGTFMLGAPANHRGMQLFYDQQFPVKKLFEAKQRPEDTRHYYSVGWLLTHYLTFSPARPGQLKKYLAAVNSGTASDLAARAAFGDLDKLDAEIQRYKTTRLMGYEVKPAGYKAPKVSIRPLNAAEEAMMPAVLRSKRGVDKKSAPRIATDARSRAQAYPAHPFAQIALAEAEYDAGNLDAAEAAADRALAAEPSSIAALNYKGLIDMKRAEKDKARFASARGWFAKANRLQPNNPEALINNYVAYEKEGSKIPELTIIGLERAFELAPFDREVRFLLSRQLLREGRGKSARTVLAPVAFSPHGGKVKEAAEKVLASIDKGDLNAAAALADAHIDQVDSGDD